METVVFLVQIKLNFVPNCLINNMPALVQNMAWRQLSDYSNKPITWYNDGLVYWHIYASLGHTELYRKTAPLKIMLKMVKNITS